MLRILYGVSGQGFGHCMRSQVIIDHLLKQGHQVEVLAYGQALPYLRQFFSCHDVAGMHLVYKDNRVDYMATVVKDMKKIPEIVKSYKEMSAFCKQFKPDIVISDYEPMSAWLAHRFRLPLMSIGNHHFVTHTKHRYPDTFSQEYLTMKMVTQAMTPRAKTYVVMSIAPVAVKNKKTHVIQPIVAPEVVDLIPEDKGSVLVYVTSPFDALLDVFHAVPDVRFVVYGFNRDEEQGNVTLRSFSRAGFLEDMRQSTAVIANAGFTTISEALYLHKPYMALPVGKQAEQMVNAWYIEKMGFGEQKELLTSEDIRVFLSHLPSYREMLRSYPREGNGKALEVIDAEIGNVTNYNNTIE